MNTTARAGLFASLFTRLRFPQLFGVLLSLFLIDLVIPDFVPFLDELLLGGMTALIGLWKRDSTANAAPAAPTAAEKPPMKNVTPGR